MSIDANSLQVNLIVTGLVLVMVFVLPWIDRRVCRKLGLNLEGGVSTHPKADALLRVRQLLLIAVFGVYLAALAWLVFFSRAAAKEYTVHTALFEDLKKAVRIDFGFLEAIRVLLSEGLKAALSHVKIVQPSGFTQVYMNLVLFVPLGYLLPYISAWFRARVHIRPALACFLTSFVIENIQLITRRGFYDLDDLVANTAGGIVGQLLFISAAYVVTHPNWRKELKAYRRWKRNAKSRTLYPFARRMGLSRTTLTATNEEEVWDFYVMKLGFRLLRQLVPLDRPGTDMLLVMGKLQLEIHCTNDEQAPQEQSLTLSARRLPPIIRRLNANGIETGPIEQDPYTKLRSVRFDGPDHVHITVIES